MAYTSTLVKPSNVLAFPVKDAPAYAGIARYENEGFLISGTIVSISKTGTIPSLKDKGYWKGRSCQYLTIVIQQTKDKIHKTVVIFQDQGEEIWSLSRLQVDNDIDVVVGTYTSKSGRFTDMHRVWKIVPHECVANELRLEKSKHLLALTSSLPNPEAMPLNPAATAARLLQAATHQWKNDLNHFTAYLP